MSFIVQKPDLTQQKYGPAKTDIYIKKEAGAQRPPHLSSSRSGDGTGRGDDCLPRVWH